MHINNTQLQESIMSALSSSSQVWHPVELTMNLEEQGFEFSVAEVRSLLNTLVREGKVFEHLEGYMLLEEIAIDSKIPEDIAPDMFSDQDKADFEWLTSIPKTAFVASGLAIASIRNKRLYRIEYDTFEEFCQKELGYSRDTVYKLMVAAEIYCQLKNVDHWSTKSTEPEIDNQWLSKSIESENGNKLFSKSSNSKNVDNLSTFSQNSSQEKMGTNGSQTVLFLPTCERQVRPLAKFKPDKRIRYWQLAVEKAGGIPTAKIVKQIVLEQESMESSAKYKPEEGKLRCGTVVRISGQQNPELKVFHNCWAQIVGVNENSYDLLAWNGAKTEVHRNDFSVLPKADPDVARSLVERLNRIRFQLQQTKNEDIHLRAFLQYLGTQESPELTPWSELILKRTEASI